MVEASKIVSAYTLRPVILLLVGLLSIGGCCNDAMAQDSRYCGLYCVGAAAEALGKPCDLEALVVPENMSGVNGSTATDLMRVLADLDIRSNFASHTNWDAVAQSSSPVLLHCRSIATSGYRHWVLYLGQTDDSGEVKVYDVSTGVTNMSADMLAATWSGAAIFTESSTGSWWKSRMSQGAIVVIALSFVLVNRFHAMLRDRDRKFAVWPLMAACVSGIFIQVVVQTTSPIGLMHPEGVAVVAANSGGSRRIDEFVASSLKDFSGELRWIDARLPLDFEMGTIPDSVSLPITFSYPALSSVLKKEGFEAKQKLVVFCQSEGCDYSDRLARILQELGFMDVRIYRQGYVGYQTLASSTESGAS